MSLRANNLALRWVFFAGVVVGAVVLGRAAVRNAVAQHWEGTSDPERWLQAAQLEPSNSENWYRLGRYRQFDFEHADLPMAISYYERATMLNPASALYWMDLGAAYETKGDFTQAEQALRTAQQVYPASGEVAWRFGNFLLRRGRTDEAFQQIHRAISADPSITSLAVSRCWRSTGDIDRILKSVLPANADNYWGAIDFFMSIQELDPAMAVWTRLVSSGAHFPPSRATPFFDVLIASGRAAEAKKVWLQTLAITGGSPGADSEGSLIWNGGFEKELGWGFDWRYRPIDGANVNFDVTNVHEGNRSLRVVFDGTANVNFANVWQYVVVEPRTHYRFSAFIRSQELTTDSGIRFQIDDYSQPQNSPQFKADPPQFTPNVIGTRPWMLDQIEFTTGPETNLLHIALERSPSDRFGNKISGTVWVDDVSLVPLPSTTAVGR